MSKQGNPGINQLACVLQGHLMSIVGEGAKDLVADFGVINADYSLTTNTFPRPIPRPEYNVCRSVTYNPAIPLTLTYCDGAHGHPDAGYGGAHVHQVLLPEKMYWIRPGDRVLVLWVQNEAVIVDIVYRGDRVG